MNVGQPVPIIRPEDLAQLSPVVFGFTVEWGPYAAEVEARCRKITDAGDEPLLVVVTSDRYLAWSAVNGVSPNSSVTLSWYARHRVDEGECYEFASGVDVPLETAALDDLAEQLSVAAFGSGVADAVLDAAQTLAEQLVRAAGRALPADGWLRVRHPGAPAPAEERFDAASAGVGVERSFPADTFELICSHVTIACLTGGSLAAEQFRRRELGCVIWSITPDAVEALTGSGGAAFIARYPDAIPEGIVPSTIFDAPVELEPLP